MPRHNEMDWVELRARATGQLYERGTDQLVGYRFELGVMLLELMCEVEQLESAIMSRAKARA